MAIGTQLECLSGRQQLPTAPSDHHCSDQTDSARSPVPLPLPLHHTGDEPITAGPFKHDH